MDSYEDERCLEVTQLSFGGFDDYVTAQMLSEFLEREAGVNIWRCRMKTSWTPLDSYPDFGVEKTDVINKSVDYEKVVPHAFVHFSSSKAVNWVIEADGRGDLVLANKPLILSLGPKNSSRMAVRRRTIDPIKLYNADIEIGTLVSRDELLVGWRGPSAGVEFIIDHFDAKCKILFTKDVAFAFKGQNKHAVIKCDIKLEFLVRDIRDIKEYDVIGSLAIMVQLESPPLVFYRTADDDIPVPVPFDLLDDEDP